MSVCQKMSFSLSLFVRSSLRPSVRPSCLPLSSADSFLPPYPSVFLSASLVFNRFCEDGMFGGFGTLPLKGLCTGPNGIPPPTGQPGDPPGTHHPSRTGSPHRGLALAAPMMPPQRPQHRGSSPTHPVPMGVHTSPPLDLSLSLSLSLSLCVRLCGVFCCAAPHTHSLGPGGESQRHGISLPFAWQMDHHC